MRINFQLDHWEDHSIKFDSVSNIAVLVITIWSSNDGRRVLLFSLLCINIFFPVALHTRLGVDAHKPR